MDIPPLFAIWPQWTLFIETTTQASIGHADSYASLVKGIARKTPGLMRSDCTDYGLDLFGLPPLNISFVILSKARTYRRTRPSPLPESSYLPPPWSPLALRQPTSHPVMPWAPGHSSSLPLISGIDTGPPFGPWATIIVGGLGNKAVRVTCGEYKPFALLGPIDPYHPSSLPPLHTTDTPHTPKTHTHGSHPSIAGQRHVFRKPATATATASHARARL